MTQKSGCFFRIAVLHSSVFTLLSILLVLKDVIPPPLVKYRNNNLIIFTLDYSTRISKVHNWGLYVRPYYNWRPNLLKCCIHTLLKGMASYLLILVILKVLLIQRKVKPRLGKNNPTFASWKLQIFKKNNLKGENDNFY